ncbi:reverse transcriptase domain-containing protein [Tanacetum coccineum]
MLARCEETNLVLNWEKCHFMVKEGIVLGHKISKARIEVDKAKVDVITKLPYPTNIKGIRSFLGYAGFYRRFIKDFSKNAWPMTQLLTKDTKFVFSNECIKSFDILRSKLTTASVIFAPNWNLDFELMCDASDYAEFTIEIKDKKGSENLAADHLSRLENPKPTRGHYGADITTSKVFKAGFYWLTIFKDSAMYVRECDACQRARNISARNQMPRTNILVSEVFDIWGIDFMRPFPLSQNKKYILVAVDYVSKWVEAEALPTNDARVVVKFLQNLLATPYHPQTSGQTENTNRAIKRILERTINGNKKEWADKLDDALRAFRTPYKAPIGSTPFRIVYGKACHLPLKMEHKAYWALKKINLDLEAPGKHRLLQLNQLDELRTKAYEHSRAYKEQTKRWHDAKLMDKEFQE